MIWDVRYHRQLAQYVLYLEAGHGADGAPLAYATPLLPEEAALWLQQDRDGLARRLRARGIPLPGPREGKFRRFLKALRRKFFAARNA